MSGEVREVWGAYHERERLCPEGVRVREIAHVHYGAARRVSEAGLLERSRGSHRGEWYRRES